MGGVGSNKPFDQIAKGEGVGVNQVEVRRGGGVETGGWKNLVEGVP